ncbi:MAG TPA: hypothetical protein VGO67_22105 [Verrucomicrobiae bacterium]
MSFKTVEVELEDGRVRPFGAEKLPDKARALLVILGATEPEEVTGPSLADLCAPYAGIGNGTHTDLSTNKKYMDDFGRPKR